MGTWVMVGLGTTVGTIVGLTVTLGVKLPDGPAKLCEGATEPLGATVGATRAGGVELTEPKLEP